MSWKPELDAIVGARHGGKTDHILRLLTELAARHPHVAEISYQLAWTLDTADKPAEARPHYEKAVALGLAPNELSGALLGLGSTLTRTGQAPRAVEVLEAARRQFPENREFDAFLALALHAAGRSAEALQLALGTWLDTTEDLGLAAYQRALRHHASQLA